MTLNERQGSVEGLVERLRAEIGRADFASQRALFTQAADELERLSSLSVGGVGEGNSARAVPCQEPQASATEVAYRKGLSRAAEICADQMAGFLSPEYATNQPLSSFSERFACAECVKAILIEGASAAGQALSRAVGGGSTPKTTSSDPSTPIEEAQT